MSSRALTSNIEACKLDLLAASETEFWGRVEFTELVLRFWELCQQDKEQRRPPDSWSRHGKILKRSQPHFSSTLPPP